MTIYSDSTKTEQTAGRENFHDEKIRPAKPMKFSNALMPVFTFPSFVRKRTGRKTIAREARQ